MVTAMIEGLYRVGGDALSEHGSMSKESHPLTSDTESHYEEDVGDATLTLCSDASNPIKYTAEPKLLFDFDAALTYNGYSSSPCTLVRTLSDEDLCRLI